jgi:hypothetical protein
MNVRALVIACLLAGTSVGAQQKNLPEEFAATESIVMQEADELQTSTRFRYFRLPEEKTLTLAGQFEYGLTDRWQVEGEVPYTFLNPDDGRAVSGLGDVELATRYAVRDYRTEPWALDVGLGVGVPTGNRGHELGEGRVTLGPFFTVSQWFGTINAQFNAGWQRAVSNAGAEPKDDFAYNLALVCPVRDWFVVVEGNGETTHRATKYYLTPEVVWKPCRKCELLVAVPVGLTGAAGDYGLVAAVTIELGGVTGRGKDKD